MKAMLTALVLVIGMGGVALADPTSCNGCAIEEQQPTQTADPNNCSNCPTDEQQPTQIADPVGCSGCAIEEQQPTQTAGCENGGCAIEEPVATDDC